MIYLNNAATSYPKAPGVPEAVGSTLRGLPGAANRGGIEDFDVLGETRKELALLMGVSSPDHIALGSNATWGLNIGICGLGLTKDDVVLTTAAEHNSVLRPLYALSVSPGITVHHLAVNQTGRVRLEDWEAALQRYRPRLCVVTHASNVTGAINDVSALAALAHEYDALIMLDLAQTLGCEPVQLEDWDIDLAAFTGHKYLLGPQGTGGLCVKPGLDLDPLLTGGTGIHSDLDTMPPTMPLHLEAGTNNEPGYAGLLQALKWQRINPWPTVQVAELLDVLKSELRHMGATVIDPCFDSSSIDTGSNNTNTLSNLSSDYSTRDLDSSKTSTLINSSSGSSKSSSGSDSSNSNSGSDNANAFSGLSSGNAKSGSDSNNPNAPCTPVVSFTMPGLNPDYLGETLLDSYDIIVRTGLHCAPRIFEYLGVDPTEGTVRASLSRFTSREDIEELLVALREIIESEEDCSHAL